MTSAKRLLAFDLSARRELAQVDSDAPFSQLADGLAAELEPLLSAPPPIPSQKARLTRIGGRCPEHGVFLEFDPWSPHAHRCAKCARAYVGVEHDEWWAMGAQLWTVERAVHAAALFVLRGRAEHATLAANILRAYADCYSSWPNADNVLGPSRPFFSTYLESIWLLNISHALALLESVPSEWTARDGASIRERVIEPSAALIASFNEGASNRQVWNEVAVCSALVLLHRETEARERMHREGGVRWQIANGLDDRGSWYEGENYHLFAHRGLWYGVQLARALGEPLATSLDARYSSGFVAPFAGLLPDERFPSRRDAQYGNSIRQWRTAEWCELGWAHSHDPQLAHILGRIYDGRLPRGETARARSTADAERNTPPTALTRSDLSWRALLMADANVSTAHAPAPSSVREDAQGLAVIRRERGRVYVALEGGQLGGGHGHPDQLALTLQTDDARWLEDPGTGSYVEPELRWYRSTLAHAAPLVDHASQSPVAARVVAFDDRGGVGWMVKRVDDLAPGVNVERTVIVCDGYVVDVLEWTADAPHVIELPIAGAADVLSGLRSTWRAVDRVSRADETEQLLSDVEAADVGAQLELRVHPTFAGDARDVAPSHLWYASSVPCTIQRAMVPAAPGQGRMWRYWLAAKATHGRYVGVWSYVSDRHRELAVREVSLTPSGEMCATIITRDATTAIHSRVAHGWHVDLHAGAAKSSLDLEGLAETTEQPKKSGASHASSFTPTSVFVPRVTDSAAESPAGSTIPGALRIELGERHYVQTEQSWSDAGSPTASLQCAVTTSTFILDVHVRTGAPIVSPNARENPLDNELDDVNADGLQWYARVLDAAAANASEWSAAGLHVPSEASGSAPRATTLVASTLLPDAEWQRTDEGWAMRLRWSRSSLPMNRQGELAFELAVNERPEGRERRRGQLVWSGGGGFGYLAGSRRPVERFVRLRLEPIVAETRR